MSQPIDPLAEIRARVGLVFHSSAPLEKARDAFLGEWYRSVRGMTDAEARAFQADLLHRMAMIAQSPFVRGDRK
jgi:hypothetical protein